MKHRHPGKYETHSPRGKLVFKRRPIHRQTWIVYKRPPSKLSKEHRSIFQRLDRKPYETGGYMDFNKKGLERADIYIGRKGSVDIPTTADSEVDYHTHPLDKDKKLSKLNYFPSKWDLKTFKDYPSQAMLIFHNDNATITTKTPKFRVNNKLINKIDRNITKDAEKLSTEELFKKYKPEYGKLGLDMKYINHNKAIRIPIDIVEPVKIDKSYKSGWIFDIDKGPIEKGYTNEGRYLFQGGDENEE